MLSPAVRDFIASLGEPGPLSGEIHPSDEMFLWNVEGVHGSVDAGGILYFEKGRQIADAFAAVLDWRFRPRGPRTLLDFASGFGRATRFLAGRLPECEVSVAEIDPEAVRFQTGAFGVSGFVSSGRPEEFDPGRSFDAVTAASFFSHLPAGAFERWLERLYALVSPGGALVFSTHGASLKTSPAGFTGGIAFEARSETERLDPAAYGTSWVTPEFVARAAADASAGEGVLHAVPFGLCGHQDLYALAKPPAVPTGPLSVPSVPRGDVEASALPEGRRLSVSGWAESDPAPSVELFVGGFVRERSPAPPGSPRRDWAFDIPIDGIDPNDVIRVVAVSREGVSRIVAIGTLSPYL